MIETKKQDRLIGILGGMGPEATLDLYHHIISLTPAKRDQDHIRVLIYSNPKIPNRTEAIAGNGESPLSYLIESAKLLERGGAGVIAIPCNASHHFLPEIQAQVNIPILDMIAATCARLSELLPGVKAAGLIATLGTIQSGVYHKVLSRAGIELLTPDEGDQRAVQAGIARVKAGEHNRSTGEVFHSVGRRLVKAGANAVILGCTEVPLVFNPGEVDYVSLNSTRILAEAAVSWALGKEYIRR